nr:unnamed protein product [Digitaria exilis]
MSGEGHQSPEAAATNAVARAAGQPLNLTCLADPTRHALPVQRLEATGYHSSLGVLYFVGFPGLKWTFCSVALEKRFNCHGHGFAEVAAGWEIGEPYARARSSCRAVASRGVVCPTCWRDSDLRHYSSSFLCCNSASPSPALRAHHQREQVPLTPLPLRDPARGTRAIKFMRSVFTRLLAQNRCVFTGVRFTVLDTPPPSNDYTTLRLLPVRLRRTYCTASTELPASNLYDYFEQGQSRNTMSSDGIPPAGNGATDASGKDPASGYISIRAFHGLPRRDHPRTGTHHTRHTQAPRYGVGLLYLVQPGREPDESGYGTVKIESFWPVKFAARRIKSDSADESAIHTNDPTRSSAVKISRRAAGVERAAAPDIPIL